jgi:hypothetical protein
MSSYCSSAKSAEAGCEREQEWNNNAFSSFACQIAYQSDRDLNILSIISGFLALARLHDCMTLISCHFLQMTTTYMK